LAIRNAANPCTASLLLRNSCGASENGNYMTRRYIHREFVIGDAQVYERRLRDERGGGGQPLARHLHASSFLQCVVSLLVSKVSQIPLPSGKIRRRAPTRLESAWTILEVQLC